jgi:hypothetical protein
MTFELHSRRPATQEIRMSSHPEVRKGWCSPPRAQQLGPGDEIEERIDPKTSACRDFARPTQQT